ncbi:MAG TPA: ABC transporter ATP-binding protein [Anaerolineales bacterium]|nr:ABC transporter ATP-binding protein [Anaerolineales bacterium]
MILTEDLSKDFGSFHAVDGVSLKVPKGEVLALLGPNGAGKTTTIRMITSILRPTRGWAEVNGYDVVSQADEVRRSVGVLTENHGLYNRMPAGEYLDFFGQLYGMEAAERRARSASLFRLFDLEAWMGRPVGEFSKGMRQKLALARALYHSPPVLLLDEPTSAMDPESARLVRDAIRELRSEDRTLVLCTHNLAEAEELADSIAIIRHGRIIAQGSPSDLKARFMGPEEYEVRLGTGLNGAAADLPPGAILTGKGEDWFRFCTENAQLTNPALLKSLLERGIPVITLQHVPRTLENVYLRVINEPEGGVER